MRILQQRMLRVNFYMNRGSAASVGVGHETAAACVEVVVTMTDDDVPVGS